MRALLPIVLLGALLGACGDNLPARGDSGADDAGVDAPQALKHCLDERAALATPPSGMLPCDLLPPGFGP